jgi:hypothetical protein
MVMHIMMFLTVVLMLGGIAGMQYLALCEQRATQWRLDRVRAALTAYNDRRHVPPLTVEELMGAPFMEFIR